MWAGFWRGPDAELPVHVCILVQDDGTEKDVFTAETGVAGEIHVTCLIKFRYRVCSTVCEMLADESLSCARLLWLARGRR